VEAFQKNGNIYRCPWSLYVSFEIQVTRLACLLPLLTNCSSLQCKTQWHLAGVLSLEVSYFVICCGLKKVFCNGFQGIGLDILNNFPDIWEICGGGCFGPMVKTFGTRQSQTPGFLMSSLSFCNMLFRWLTSFLRPYGASYEYWNLTILRDKMLIWSWTFQGLIEFWLDHLASLHSSASW
jgi:hypothetical protein